MFNMLFKSLAALAMLGFVACENKGCSGIDVTLLKNPHAFSPLDDKNGSLAFFAQAMFETSQEVTPPVGHILEMKDMSRDIVDGIKNGRDALENIFTLIQTQDLTDKYQIANFDKSLISLYSLDPTIKAENNAGLTKSYSFFKKTYGDFFCSLALSNTKEKLESFINDCQDNLFLANQLNKSHKKNAELKLLRDNLESIVGLKSLIYFSSSVLTNAFSLVKNINSLYVKLAKTDIQLEDDFKKLNTIANKAKDFITETKTSILALNDCGDFNAKQSQVLNNVLSFNPALLLPLKVSLAIKNSSNKILYSSANEYDSKVLASFLHLTLKKQVLFLDLAKVYSKAKEFGLKEVDFSTWIVSLLQDASKDDTIIVLTNLSYLKHYLSSSNKSDDLLFSRLSKIFIEVKKGIVLVEVLKENDSLFNQKFSNVESIKSSSIDLVLSKSIVNNLFKNTVRSKEEKYLSQHALMQIASIIRAFDYENYTLGTLYNVWLKTRDIAWKKSKYNEQILLLGKSFVNFNDENPALQDLLNLSFEETERILSENIFSFTQYKKPDLYKVAQIELRNQAFLAIKSGKKSAIDQIRFAAQQADETLQAKKNELLGEVATKKDQLLGEVDVKKQVIADELSHQTNDFLEQLNNKKEDALQNLAQTKNVLANDINEQKNQVLSSLDANKQTMQEQMKTFSDAKNQEALEHITAAKEASLANINKKVDERFTRLDMVLKSLENFYESNHADKLKEISEAGNKVVSELEEKEKIINGIKESFDRAQQELLLIKDDSSKEQGNLKHAMDLIHVEMEKLAAQIDQTNLQIFSAKEEASKIIDEKKNYVLNEQALLAGTVNTLQEKIEKFEQNYDGFFKELENFHKLNGNLSKQIKNSPEIIEMKNKLSQVIERLNFAISKYDKRNLLGGSKVNLPPLEDI